MADMAKWLLRTCPAQMLVFALALGIILTSSTGCAQSSDPEVGEQSHVGYDFSTPDAQFKLDKKLTEISGLTVLDSTHLAAVEDERGRVYILDAETGDIVETRHFAGKGDYEGIELAAGRLFALRSDGQLFEVEDYGSDDADGKKIRTPLKKGCDAEGLAYDIRDNRLLIACKEDPGNGMKKQRAIYALDLDSLELTNEPIYTISTGQVEESSDTATEIAGDFLSPFVDLHGFKPSGLAIHPITDEIYVLSSVLKVLVVLTRDGDIRTIISLDGQLLEQPEGITFLPNGDLFISSEGGEKKARLVRYNYDPA
jgi:uncharacterized protein YjiK